jgi:hypothetical protein
MNEDFLTRWSRRKRDGVETGQAKTAPGEHGAVPEDAVRVNAPPVEASKPATPPEPAFDLKSLPSIESITAATDIRPFLAPAVPLEIARAALRRAWSVDPRIRNFVGLADYDWDYHTPGSAAGFGPLEMTDELRRMVTRILGDIGDADQSKEAKAPVTDTECMEESRPLGPEPKRLAASEGGRTMDLPKPAGRGERTAALQHEISQDHAPASHQPIRRWHGSALPK